MGTSGPVHWCSRLAITLLGRGWSARRHDFDAEKLFRQRGTSDVVTRLSAILDVISDLLADGCQIEELLLNKDIFGFFGKLPIHNRLLPKIVIPVHAWSSPSFAALLERAILDIAVLRALPMPCRWSGFICEL